MHETQSLFGVCVCRTLSSAAGVRVIGWPLDMKAWNYQKKSLHKFVEELDIADASCPSGNWEIVFNYTREAERNRNPHLQVKTLNPDTAFVPYGMTQCDGVCDRMIISHLIEIC